ncbi:type II toxin-antitoxin system HicB family antitoxin [Candidatus Bipolaricaulota bacterium]|nr:type II toxin-antitoxin system HicB family antitoxin [Candidatus Bipolaricaulota bacterium]
MKYRIIIEQDEDGVYVAECPTLPGCISQGNSREEALTNIQDAVKGYLESLRKHDEPIPPSSEKERRDVNSKQLATIDVAGWDSGLPASGGEWR